MSKGSRPRPSVVDREERERRWDRIEWRSTYDPDNMGTTPDGRTIKEMRSSVDPRAVYPFRPGLF